MLKKIKTFLFQNQTLRQTIAKNAFWLAFGEIISRLLRAAIIIYAARILGAANWGIFSYAITLAAFFTIFSDIGLGAILTREAAKTPELRLKYFSTTFFIKSIFLILSIGLIILAAPFFTKIQGVKSLLPIVALIFIFDGLREFCFSFNRALEKMEREAIVKIFTNFSIAVLGFIFLVISTTSYSLTFSYLIGSALGFLAMILFLRNSLKGLFSNFDRKLLRPIFSSAWPFALLGVLGSIMLNTDIIMLGWWRTAEEIGYYSAAQRLILFFYIIPALLATAVFPTFSRFAKKDDNRFRQILEKSIALSLLLGIPLVFGGLIMGKEVILLLFGNQYLNASIAFQILLVNILIVFPNVFISNAVFAYDKQKNFIGFVSIGAFGNVILNYLLIPSYGIAGSAIATIAAQFLANGFIWSKMKKINYFVILPHLKKIFLAALVMAIITFAFIEIKVNLFINLFLSIIIYFSLLIVLKESLLKEIGSIFKK